MTNTKGLPGYDPERTPPVDTGVARLAPRSSTNEILVAHTPRGQRELLCVWLKTFTVRSKTSSPFVWIDLWYRAADDTLRATGRGISIRLSEIESVASAIDEILRRLRVQDGGAQQSPTPTLHARPKARAADG